MSLSKYSAMRLSVLLVVAWAWCQTVSAENLYEIEVLVFEYLKPIGLDGERQPEQMVFSELSERSLQLQLQPETLEELGVDEQALQELIEPLEEDDLQLKDVWQRLKTSSLYRPTLHLGWRQPSFGDEEAFAVQLGEAVDSAPAEDVLLEYALEPVGIPEGSFTGWLRLRTSVYLHLDADFFFGARQFEKSALARLRESRRVKFKELHYFDNPFFGLLIQVRSVESEDDINEEIVDEVSQSTVSPRLWGPGPRARAS